MRLLVLLTAILILPVRVAVAHEFWIEPLKYQAPVGDMISASLKNGQDFKGSEQPFFPQRLKQVKVNGEKYQGRLGDIPAINIESAPDGLMTMTVLSEPASVKYREWAKFDAFVTEKGLHWAATQHAARGLETQNFWETYTRHSKALIAIGSGAGADRRHGMHVEFVALQNPYTQTTNQLEFSLWAENGVLENHRVTVFEADPKGHVTTSLYQTNSAGHVTIDVKAGHTYLLDAVTIIATQGGRAVWHTDWAALTFAIPQR